MISTQGHYLCSGLALYLVQICTASNVMYIR